MQVPIQFSRWESRGPSFGVLATETGERTNYRTTDRVGDDMEQGYCRDVVYVLQLLQTLPRCGPYTADRIAWAGAARTDGWMLGSVFVGRPKLIFD